MELFESSPILTKRRSTMSHMQHKFAEIQADLNESATFGKVPSHETDYCEICCTNVIQLGPARITDDITFEFKTCKHRFCIECCREMLRQHIERAEIKKLICFQHKCGGKVTMDELDKLFKEDEPETLEKMVKFKEKKLNEADPLMRWCTKAGCKGTVRGKHMDERKLQCPECGTSICFRCKEEWHGRCTTCEKAMEKKF